jgi:hypothetical protein
MASLPTHWQPDVIQAYFISIAISYVSAKAAGAECGLLPPDPWLGCTVQADCDVKGNIEATQVFEAVAFGECRQGLMQTAAVVPCMY